MRNTKLCAMAISMLSIGGVVSGQGTHKASWQTLNSPSSRQVFSQWANPPAEYGPEPYYGLNGDVRTEDVRRDLDTMKQLGFRAVTVQYGYGSSRAYLSPEFMTFFQQFVREAKQRDLRIWIVDDAGYPSGFAGGKISSDHPELRMQALVALQPKLVKSGEPFDEELSENTVSVTALNRASGDSLQLPVQNHHVRWSAPSGDWTVYVVEHVFRTSPTRSDTNTKRVKDTSQSLEDYLDPTATQAYLASTHEQYKRSVGQEFGETILGFRGDEPDYSIAGLPWTPKFFSAFQSKKGYDVRPYLAAFLQPKGTILSDNVRLAKADYYDVFADLFRDGFFKPQAEWCAANGLEYQVHLNHEEAELDLTRSEGDFFRDMRYVQVPGIDSIWHQIWTDTISDFPRLASSAAHVYGHPRAFTESFAAYRPAPDVTMARYILNEQFVRGVNLVETMYYPASVGGTKGPSQLMRDPAFPSLMQYTARMSYLLSQGHPAAEVALLLPSASLWMGTAATDDTFVSAERLLSEHQVDFDVVDEDAVGHLLKLDAGSFLSYSGNRYRTLLIPNAFVITSELAARLQAFSKMGGRTVFLGATPKFISKQNYLRSTVATSSSFQWAAVAAGELSKVPTPPAQPPAQAPQPMLVPPAFWQTIENALPPQALSINVPNTHLRVMERLLQDATVVLLFNESPEPFTQEVTVRRSKLSQVENWVTETGASHPAQFKLSKDAAQVVVNLPAYGTQVLLLR